MIYTNIFVLIFWAFCLGYDVTKSSDVAIFIDLMMVAAMSAVLVSKIKGLSNEP